MQTILFNILLFLIAVWVFIGILFLWQQFRMACRKLEKACEKKNVSFNGDNSDGRISGVFLFIGSQGPQRGGRNMDRPGGVCRTG